MPACELGVKAGGENMSLESNQASWDGLTPEACGGSDSLFLSTWFFHGPFPPRPEVRGCE